MDRRRNSIAKPADLMRGILVCMAIASAPLSAQSLPAAQQPSSSPALHDAQAAPTKNPLTPPASPSSSPTGQQRPRRYAGELAEARQAYEAGKTDAAEKAFQAIIARPVDSQDPLSAGDAHLGLASMRSLQANFSATRSEAEQALAIFTAQNDSLGIAHAQQWIGIAAHEAGDNNLARSMYGEALEAFAASHMLSEQANLLISLAYATEGYAERNRIDREAFEMARQAGNRRTQGKAMHAIGEWQLIQGDSDEAEKTFQQAEGFLNAPEDKSLLGRVFLSEGRLHRAHGELDHALDILRRALKLAEDSQDVQGQIQIMNAMAACFGDQKNHRDALAMFQGTLKLAVNTNSPRLVETLKQNIAEAYINLGEYQRGAEMVEEMNRQTPDPYPYGAQYRYATLALAYQNLGKYDLALTAATKAVDEARARKNGQFVSEPLLEKARAEEKLGQSREALLDVQEALKSIEELRAHLVPRDFMKRGFGEKTQEAFAYAIVLLEVTGQHPQAIAVAEQARSRAFLDLLASHQIATQRERKDNAQRSERTTLAAAILDPGPMTTRGAPPQSTTTRTAANSDPELSSAASVESASIADMQAQAARLKSTILSYWVGDEVTFVWIMDPSGNLHSAATKVKRERLAEMVRDVWPLQIEPVSPPSSAQQNSTFHDSGKKQVSAVRFPTRGEQQLTASGRQRDGWRELYRLLIAPIETYLPSETGARITIIPHGPLFALPFAGLRDVRNVYFLERYTLEYAPSISVLRFTGESKVSSLDNTPHVLLLADPSGMKQLGLPQLAGARAEVAEIAARFPPGQVTTLTGPAVLADVVKTTAARSNLIHFATHGVVDDNQPFDSFLALADGKLTARDLYGWNLNADLVFLSACRSGMGKVTGDGVLGLTRAFLYAGSRSVIATLWDVADEPTAALVTDFYSNVRRKNLDNAQALRAAQLSVLHRLRAGRIKVTSANGPLILPENPVFWASFVLIGEP